MIKEIERRIAERKNTLDILYKAKDEDIKKNKGNQNGLYAVIILAIENEINFLNKLLKQLQGE